MPPLGTFSARTSVAYLLALIQKNEFDEIEIVRRIRNELGHKWKGITFKNDRISALAMKLPADGLFPGDDENDPRSRFDTALRVLLTDLLWREQLVVKERRKERIWQHRMRKGR